jgi:hypothetical protein
MKNQKTALGIGHIIRALQLAGFGHDEIMAIREAMITRNFSNVKFVPDCYTSDWDKSEQNRIVDKM